MTFPVRGSMTLSFLSLQVVASRLPSRLKDMEWIESGWQSMVRTASARLTSHTRMLWSNPALRRTCSAVGCHST
uniref:Putative secreted protein n=1 Tax=Ixodes ricinus TaxID=34613 RepID=A0A6B0TSY6_IXORI